MISAVTLAIPVVFPHVSIVWAVTRQKLSSGFPIRSYLNQPPQLHRLGHLLGKG